MTSDRFDIDSLVERFKENPDLAKANKPTESNLYPTVAKLEEIKQFETSLKPVLEARTKATRPVKAKSHSTVPAKVSHAKFQGMVCQLAEFGGWKVQYWWKSYHSPSGFPDLFMCRPPEIILAELKVGKDNLSFPQMVWADLFNKCPAVRYFTWRPEDLDSIMEVLNCK